MKRVLFFLCMLVMYTNVLAVNINGFEVHKTDSKARVGLFLAFSGVNSKYEDANVLVEIYNQALWVTNKSDRTIYLDLAQCFAYYNDDSFCFYVSDKKMNNKEVITDIQLINIAPKSERCIGLLSNYIGGLYSSNDKKIKSEYMVHFLTEEKIEFMNVVDELRSTLENIATNSVVKHLTEDESMIRLKAAISYSFDKESKDATPVVVSSWVSDIILSKYYTLLPPPQEKTKSLAAKKINPALVCVPATTPFEYDDEKSPMMGYDITINLRKGQFILDDIFISEKKEKSVGFSVGKDGGVPIIKVDGTTYKGEVIKWLGADAGFSKIKVKNGIATFGNLEVKNTY